eukprot:Seg6644.1 transcript_id=Seg6644.1/GoldUCD/mRNA.D3Y31 product="hypothetical protein" protein_id=Seg6644.1/GoldUCD/D3Y31
MEKTNPLKISHESLEVKFDSYPRPHLIIVETASSLLKSPTFTKKYPDSAKDINEKQARSMIKCYEEIKDLVVKSFIHELLERFTLVTHLGTFATKAIFHAHIWMDTNQYKKLLHAAKHVIDKNLASYVEDVDMYSSKMSKKHEGWLKGETAAVNQAKENKQTIKVTCPDGYEVIYHQCLPYIGFRCKEEKIGEKETKEDLKKEEKTEVKETKEQGTKQQEPKGQENTEKESKSKKTEGKETEEKKTGDKKTKAEIFYDVTQFANKHKMAEGEDGCHVCLGGQPAIKFNDGNGVIAVDAFLLASVGTFYKMRCNCNVNVPAADQWWINFQNNIVNNPVLH